MRQRGELDRWILSELNRTAAAVTAPHGRVRQLRRLRPDHRVCRRTRATGTCAAAATAFGPARWTADKLDAYWTLYECLLTTARMIAPFVPFLAEALWQNLAVAGTGGRAVASVHLADFPTGDAGGRR